MISEVFSWLGLNQIVRIPALMPPWISEVRLSPHDYGCFLMEIRDSGEAAVKVFPARFIVSQFFGDKNILKVTGNSGTF